MAISYREITAFALVGVLNTAVSFVVFQLCYVAIEIGLASQPTSMDGRVDIGSVHAAVATAVGYSAGVVNSFLMNRAWTFRVEARPTGQFLRFMVVNAAGLSLSGLGMFVLVDVRGYALIPIWLLVTGTVMILNFLGSKYWVFAPP